MADQTDGRAETGTLLSQLEQLDAHLLAAVAGKEKELLEWMERRSVLVRDVVNVNPAEWELRRLAKRTTQLQEKFLHWRRSAIMEQSAIDQHARFIQEQCLDESVTPVSCLDIRA